MAQTGARRRRGSLARPYLACCAHPPRPCPPARLARGAPACGFIGAVWTRARVADVIKREFGVTYHRDHIGRLLKAIGWTVQKPTERATQRDEEEIAAWRERKWPEIKKKPWKRDARSSG